MGTFDAPSTEALAIVDSRKRACKLGINHIIGEADCLFIVNKLNSDILYLLIYGSIVKEVVSLCDHFSFFAFVLSII